MVLMPMAAFSAESGLGRDDFYWQLSLTPEARKGEGSFRGSVDLVPGRAGTPRLVARLDARQAVFLKVEARKETKLGACALGRLPSSVTLVRRGAMHYLLDGRRLLLRVRWNENHEGAPDITLSGAGLSVREILRQRTAPLLFADSFSRTAGKPGPWKVLNGAWESAVNSYAEHGANPGAVRARFSAGQLANPFEVGRLYGKRQGMGTNLAPLEGGGMAITRVTGSSPAERAGLRVGDVILSLRGKPLVGTRRLLLQSGHGAQMSVFRSGARVLSDIKIKPSAFVWGRSRRAVALPGAALGGEALLSAGNTFWGLYRLECSVRSGGGSAFGLAFALSEVGDGLLFRLKPDRDCWKAELVRLGRGAKPMPKALASKALGEPWPGSWYRLAVDISDGGDGGGFNVDCWLGEAKVLSVNVSQAGFGRVGLWASGRGGSAEFDDVLVSNDRNELRRRIRRPASYSARTVNDPFMARWSMKSRDWRVAPGSGGPARLRYPCLSGSVLTLSGLPAKQPVVISWADALDRPGCAVRLNADAGSVEALRDGKVLKRSRLPAARPLTVRCAAGRVEVSAGNKILVSAKVKTEALPLVSVRPASAAIGGLVSARALSGVDIGFDRAPTELVTSAGAWGLANRWVCDPRWSWFSGRADPLCASWTARRFDGDQRMEVDAALLMDRLHGPFEIPRDLGLSICGNGRSLWSGYTLVFGADNNRSTRLYRKGLLVAETRKESARFPDDFFNNPSRSAFHQKWYRLGLELSGRRVVFKVNDEVQLEWQDSDPLPGGRMALWKMRGGVLLARVRADAQRVGPLLPDLRASAPVVSDAALVAARAGGGGPEIVHLGEGVWRARSLEGRIPCTRFNGSTVDPNADSIVGFKLRAPKGAGIDLYLEAGSERYRVGLTGPPPSARREELEVNWLGRAKGVRADGRWHEIRLDTGPLWRDYWRRRYPRKAMTRGTRLRVSIGCYAEGGYRCTGLGVRAKDAWYEATALRVEKVVKDQLPPDVGQPRFSGNIPAQRARLVVPLSDSGGSGLNTRKLAAVVGGRVLRVGSPGLEYSELDGLLTIDLGAIRAARDATGRYGLALKGIVDRAGNRVADAKFQVEPDRQTDKRPPEGEMVGLLVGGRSRALALGPERCRAARAAGTYVVQRRFPERSGDVDRCDVVGMVDGSALCVYVTPPASRFDLGRFPELDMGCRFGPTSPLAMVMRAGRSWTVAAVNEAPVRSNGQIAWLPGVPLRADRSYQRVTLPLAKMCYRSNPTMRRRPTVASLRFGETGDRRSRAGTHLSFGDLRLVPVVNPKGLVLSWSAWDAGTVVDCRSSLDNKPATVPGNQLLRSGKPVPPEVGAALKEGDAWLHLSFVDKSGNWSPAKHYRIIVDRSAPELLRRDPAGEVGARCDGLDLYVDDPGGVDPKSVVLSVDGRAYPLAKSPALFFDAAKGRLRWDARLATGEALKAGQQLKAKLSCSDYAGNIMAPVEFAWKVDPSGDKRAPEVRRVRFAAAGAGRRPLKGIGRRALTWRRLSPISGVRVTRHLLPEMTKRLTRTDSREPLAISMEPRPWRLDYYPCLEFEYRATRGMRLELVFGVSGREIVIPFAGAQGAAAVADGKWRHAGIDLATIARRKLGPLPLYCVWSMVLREPPGVRNRAGSFLELRNTELWTGRSAGTRFLVEGRDDSSGLDGFAVVLDRAANTMPPEKVNLPVVAATASAAWKPGKLEAGTWWLHVRAADLAGNWSKAEHFRLVVPERSQAEAAPAKKGSAGK